MTNDILISMYRNRWTALYSGPHAYSLICDLSDAELPTAWGPETSAGTVAAAIAERHPGARIIAQGPGFRKGTRPPPLTTLNLTADDLEWLKHWNIDVPDATIVEEEYDPMTAFIVENERLNRQVLDLNAIIDKDRTIAAWVVGISLLLNAALAVYQLLRN